MRYLRQSNNQRVVLPEANAIGAGGEARVFAVHSDPRYAAKIYHSPTSAQERKLAVMVANPPDDPTLDTEQQSHISIAWPIDLLRTMYGERTFAGFLMPRVTGMRPLFNIYNPVTRRQECPLFNYLYLHRAARNVTSAVRALHNRGYVIGDVNESNLLVSETALVTFVDTDSFQVYDALKDSIYRCPVGKPEFTPPELQGCNFRQVDRSRESDLFGLAVLIFQLLMEGTHPFSGIYIGDEDPPPYESRIRNGHFTYGTRQVPYRPMPLAPTLDMVHPTLRSLFLRCFEDGHAHPELRPDATTWASALRLAEKALIVCSANPQHLYGDHLDLCPWCLRKDLLGGRDPFPLQAERPYVRPGRDTRKVERPVFQTPISGGAGTTKTVVITRAPGASIATNAPSNLPNWPVSPSTQYGTPGSPPALRNLPNYHSATWLAAAFAMTSTIFPGFHLLFGILAIVTGGVGWMGMRQGRWLASLSVGIGTLVSIIILVGAFQRSYIATDLRVIEEQGPVRAVSFSPDSRSLICATERNEDQRLISGEAAIFDTQSGDLVKTFIFPGDVGSVAYSRDGRLLAAGSGSLLERGKVGIWEVGTWRRLGELTGFRGDVTGVAFSPDNRQVLTGCRDRTVGIWDRRTGAALRFLDGQGEVFSVAYSPDGTRFAAGSGSSGSGLPGHVTVWNATTGTMLWTNRAHSERCLSVAFAPDGRTLASAGNDNTVRLWDVQTGTSLAFLECRGVYTVNGVAFSPDGKRLVCGGSDGNARLWDLSSRSIVQTFHGGDTGIESVAFASNGKLVAGGTRKGTIDIWRVK